MLIEAQRSWTPEHRGWMSMALVRMSAIVAMVEYDSYTPAEQSLIDLNQTCGTLKRDVVMNVIALTNLIMRDVKLSKSSRIK